MFQVGNLNKRREGGIMNYVDGKLKIVGGSYRDWGDDGNFTYNLKDVEEFDFETMTWSLTDEELIETVGLNDRGIEIPVSMLP